MLVDPSGKRVKALFQEDVATAQQSSSSLDAKPSGKSIFDAFKKDQK